MVTPAAVLAAATLLAMAVLAVPAQAQDVALVMTTCRKEVGISRDELEAMLDRRHESMDLSKKWALCVLRALEILDSENKYSKDAVVVAAGLVIDEMPAVREIVQEIAEICEPEVTGDSAEEVAKGVWDCFKNQAEERAKKGKKPAGDEKE